LPGKFSSTKHRERLPDETATLEQCLSRAAQRSLERWQVLLTTKDFEALTSVLAEDVVFHSPVGLKPYPGRALVLLVLSTAASVFEEFQYRRHYLGKNSAALEFSARVGGQPLKGIHLLQFNAAGQIMDIEKFVRPAKVAVTLGNAIGDKTGNEIKALRHGPTA
jgi:hypothetical protein